MVGGDGYEGEYVELVALLPLPFRQLARRRSHHFPTSPHPASGYPASLSFGARSRCPSWKARGLRVRGIAGTVVRQLVGGSQEVGWDAEEFCGTSTFTASRLNDSSLRALPLPLIRGNP